jgi:hypothetical protein
MRKITIPIVCPVCQSTDLCEVSENVHQRLVYRYVGSNSVTYEEAESDDEIFGSVYLVCGKCGHGYDEETYEAWLECL